MRTKTILFILITLLFTACSQLPEGHHVVICIPVYGQSLALGEEAERITDFDSLANYADGRIVTENLDHDYGYFENNDMKRFAKKMVGYQKRSFELSIYTMAQRLADHIGKDTLICIFPGGQGATQLSNLSKGTLPYQEFMENIKTAYKQTIEKDWDFQIPAVIGTAGMVIMIIGGAMLLFGAGRHSKGFGKVTAAFGAIYNTATGWFGDVLSYSRIMALMLAGGVVGKVFNNVALMPARNAGHFTVGSALAFVIIFVLGHTMNFGLNILGCYVHDLRLQCLEFFGKFYEDGGKPFRPLERKTKYFEIIKEESIHG